MTVGNPNHPVVRGLDQHWHKVLAIVMQKYGDVLPNELVITSDDIEAFVSSGAAAVVAHDRADGLHLRLVDAVEGEALSRREGGLAS